MPETRTTNLQDQLDAAAMATAATVIRLMEVRDLTRAQAVTALAAATAGVDRLERVDEDGILALLDRARMVAATTGVVRAR